MRGRARRSEVLPGTTIVTFLMVFLIQRTQNKDALAIHLKLNEIVAAMEGTSNRLVDVEDLTEDEIEVFHKHYQKLVGMAKHDVKLTVRLRQVGLLEASLTSSRRRVAGLSDVNAIEGEGPR